MRHTLRIIAVFLVTALLLPCLAGCGIKEGLISVGLLNKPPQTDYTKSTGEMDCVPNEEGLSSDSFYVKHEKEFYSCNRFDWIEDTEYAENGYNDALEAEDITTQGKRRYGMYSQYDGYIPTLYQGSKDTLVFTSGRNVLSYLSLVKLKDLGWTLPIVNIDATPSGYLYTTTTKNNDDEAVNLLESPLRTKIIEGEYLKEDDDYMQIRYFDVNGSKVNEQNIDRGTFIGCKREASYNMNIALGSQNTQITLDATLHMFEEDEAYLISDYETDYNNNYVFTMPDYLKTGYYLTGNGQLFRYVKEGEGYDLTDTKYFNEKQLGLDEEYTLEHGGKKEVSPDGEEIVYDENETEILNCYNAYSENPELNYYSTNYESLFGYVNDEQTEENEDGIENLEGKEARFIVAPKKSPAELKKDTKVAIFSSSLAYAPCTVRMQYQEQVITATPERDEENQCYTYTLVLPEDISLAADNPWTISVVYAEGSDTLLQSTNSALTVTPQNPDSEASP